MGNELPPDTRIAAAILVILITQLLTVHLSSYSSQYGNGRGYSYADG
jgi:hypothetical protein